MRNSALCSLFWLLASTAQAATGSHGLIDSTGVKYFINDNITFSTTSSASGAASEASFQQAVPADTLSGGTTASTLNDAFDGYGSVSINGSTTHDMYNKDGNATVACNGRVIVFNAQNMNFNLLVVRSVYVPDNDNFARWATTITNTGSSVEPVILATHNNLGSDNNTEIVYSSNPGADPNSVTDPNTSWVVSMQNWSGKTSSDPRLAHVFQGAGARVPMAGIQFVQGDDNPTWSYSFNLNPNESATILTFASANGTNPNAKAKALEIAGLTANSNAVACMTDQDKALVVNFNVLCAGVDCSGLSTACAAGVCNPNNGVCAASPINEAGTCDDANACTTADACTNGVCAGTAVAGCGGTTTGGTTTGGTTSGGTTTAGTTTGGTTTGGTTTGGSTTTSTGTVIKKSSGCAQTDGSQTLPVLLGLGAFLAWRSRRPNRLISAQRS